MRSSQPSTLIKVLLIPHPSTELSEFLNRQARLFHDLSRLLVAKPERLSKGYRHLALFWKARFVWKHFIGPDDFYRHYRNPQLLDHDTQSQLERLHFTVPGMPPFRKDQDVNACIGESSHECERTAETLCLGQRKEVEQHAGIFVG